MYHGVVMADRGIETFIKLIGMNPKIKGIILGNEQVSGYIQGLKELVKLEGACGRVYFHPAVPNYELVNYVGASDVGMILSAAICKNHLYSLPNKFFENIQSETPVICPDYPEMKRLVDHFQIGLTCNPTNIREIYDCIERLRTDKKLYNRLKENTKSYLSDAITRTSFSQRPGFSLVFSSSLGNG